jgi:hypothetical protein
MQLIAMGRWSKSFKRWSVIVPIRKTSRDTSANKRPSEKKPGPKTQD